MSTKSVDREDRREQQYRRLGTRQPSCVTCAHTNPFALQLHHPAGQKYHDDTVIECANCHMDLSDKQRDHPSPEADGAAGMMVTIGRYLLGLADMFAMLVETLRDFGQWLINAACSAEASA